MIDGNSFCRPLTSLNKSVGGVNMSIKVNEVYGLGQDFL